MDFDSPCYHIIFFRLTHEKIHPPPRYRNGTHPGEEPETGLQDEVLQAEYPDCLRRADYQLYLRSNKIIPMNNQQLTLTRLLGKKEA